MSDFPIKLMYVEDDHNIAEIVRLILGEFGSFDVKICKSGEEALLEYEFFNPDIVVLDYMMPRSSGLDTLRDLGALTCWQSPVVIFMTAKVMRADKDNYLSHGAHAVIAKPFDPMTLNDQILNLYQSNVVAA